MSALVAGLLALAVLVGPKGRTGRTSSATARRRSRPGAGRRAARRIGPEPVSTQQLLELVDLVAGQLRAGSAPGVAWSAAVDVVLPAGGTGPDPAAPDRWCAALAERPGPAAASAAAVAAACRLAERTGASAADVLDSVALACRQNLAAADDVEAALAAPRATARLLGVLPVVGLALGELIGAHPLTVLVGTPLGRLCGVLGLLLAVAGWGWTRALVRRVERVA